jgi:hypothetical protein
MDAQVLTDGRGVGEAQQSNMDDDGSSEGDFIFAPPLAAFKVFGAASLRTVTLRVIDGSLSQTANSGPQPIIGITRVPHLSISQHGSRSYILRIDSRGSKYFRITFAFRGSRTPDSKSASQKRA